MKGYHTCRLHPQHITSMLNILISRVYFIAQYLHNNDIKKTSSLKFAIHYSHHVYLNDDT